MDFATTTKSILSLLFLPPGLGLTLIIVFGVSVLCLNKRSRKRTVVRCLFVMCLALAFALTTRTVGYALALLVEGDQLRALPTANLREIQDDVTKPKAIVILGGGLRFDGREKPSSVNLNQRTALRVHYGAHVAKASGLPVLVSGGMLKGFGSTEAIVMTRSLQEDYGVEVRWQEAHSLTTAENAVLSAAMLKADGIDSIILITQAYHMRRSALAFEAQGIKVIMAPCGFLGGVDVNTHLAWLPAISGIEATYLAVHELVGLLYYRVTGSIQRFSYTP